MPKLVAYDEEDKRKKEEKEKESDTFAASLVRSVGGDDLAKDFKTIFGDWF